MAHVFGLTGGIGSGKSAVAAHWRARGLPVVDADELAREAVAPGSEGLAALVAEFGPEILDAQGRLARKRLAGLVFEDEARRARLNAITHPRVRALSVQRFLELAQRGEPLACYEVPLLVESGLTEALRPLVVVAAGVEQQIQRAMARDGAAEAEIRARIAAQLPLADKIAVADHVIYNDGTRQQLHAAADTVLLAICERLGLDVARYFG